jgi:hypothetical protein
MTYQKPDKDLLQGVEAISDALEEEGISWSTSQIYKRISDGFFRGAVAKVSHKNIIGSRSALRARIAALIAGDAA